jgi:hypothetical protein
MFRGSQMARLTPLFLAVVLACYPSGCGWHVNLNERSGSLEDDYVGEPLTDRTKRYEKALEVSNAIVERMKVDDYGSIYDDYFLPELQATVPRAIALNLPRR